MSAERKSIRVKIFGSEYPLRGDSEEFTRRVATHVDDMISSLHAKLPDQPTLTVAVLSALNITEDLFKEQDQNRMVSATIKSEVDKLAEFFDSIVQE